MVDENQSFFQGLIVTWFDQKQLCGYQRVVEENANFELGFQWKCLINP